MSILSHNTILRVSTVEPIRAALMASAGERRPRGSSEEASLQGAAPGILHPLQASGNMLSI